MNGLPMQFVVHARRVKLVDDEPKPIVNTILVFCNVCFELMPHYVEDGFVKCCCCFNRVYPRTEQE